MFGILCLYKPSSPSLRADLSKPTTKNHFCLPGKTRGDSGPRAGIFPMELGHGQVLGEFECLVTAL